MFGWAVWAVEMVGSAKRVVRRAARWGVRFIRLILSDLGLAHSLQGQNSIAAAQQSRRRADLGASMVLKPYLLCFGLPASTENEILNMKRMVMFSCLIDFGPQKDCTSAIDADSMCLAEGD